MPEVKNPTTKPVDPKVRVEKYYITKSKKVVDFLIGFFGAPAIIIATARFFSDFVALMYLLMLVACAVAFAKERRFIGLGILVVIVAIPLIVFGSCLAILGGLGR